MKKNYSKPTMKSVRLHSGSLLTGSSDGINAKISGYEKSSGYTSDDESDGFSQE